MTLANVDRFLGERYHVTFVLCHEPYVCRLSAVSNVVGLG